MNKQVDVLIVGGGLTGATLQLALARQGISALLVEKGVFKDERKEDIRALALSTSSIRILQTLAVWPLLQDQATPINTITISEQYGFGSAVLHEQGKPLGYVVEMQHINQVVRQLVPLQSLLTQASLVGLDRTRSIATIQTKDNEYCIQAKLIVAADGANSTVRRLINWPVAVHHYNQHAIVTNVDLARPHDNIAFERFTKTGPLALLPMHGQRISVVWTLTPSEAQTLLQQSDHVFLRQLQTTFGYKLGRFAHVDKRILYPLSQTIMPKSIAWPIVFVGNAAHALHPVAGQGFNLGLRDVATLAQCIQQYGFRPDMLCQYHTMRYYDHQSITWFTHHLVELFTSRLPGVSLVRRLGLMMFHQLQMLQKMIVRHAAGYAGVLPDLVCGIEEGSCFD